MNLIEKTRSAVSTANAWATAKVLGVSTLGFAGASAQAAAVDVAAVVTDIAAQSAPISLVGSAVLLVFVGVKAFQWVRKALS